MLPPVARTGRRLTPWELGALCIGVIGGPLFIISLPRHSGFGVIGWLYILPLLTPLVTISIARTERPLLIGLLGNMGLMVLAEGAFIWDMPWIKDPQYWIVNIVIVLGIFGCSVVTALPFMLSRALNKRLTAARSGKD